MSKEDNDAIQSLYNGPLNSQIASQPHQSISDYLKGIKSSAGNYLSGLNLQAPKLSGGFSSTGLSDAENLMNPSDSIASVPNQQSSQNTDWLSKIKSLFGS